MINNPLNQLTLQWPHVCSEQCNSDYIHKLELASILDLTDTYQYTIQDFASTTIGAYSTFTNFGIANNMFINPIICKELEDILK